MSAAQTESAALAVIPRESLPTILAADRDDILGKLAEKIRAFAPDVTTPRGRREIASMAHEVATSKMNLVRLANGLTDGWRAQTAAVVKERKELEARMDGLRDDIRRPLDEFEAMEERRVNAHEQILASLTTEIYDDTTAAGIGARLSYLRACPARDWQEFRARFEHTIGREIERLARLLQAAEVREAEAAELAQLRAEREQREQLAAVLEQQRREEEIAAQAAETARLEAERIAAVAIAEAAQAAERERQRIIREAEEAAQAARDAAEEEAAATQRELDAADQREQDARDAQAAAEERTRQIEAAAQAEREQAAAKHRKELLGTIEWLKQPPPVNPDWPIEDKIAHLESVLRRIPELLSEREWGDLEQAAQQQAAETTSILTKSRSKFVHHKAALDEAREQAIAERATEAEQRRQRQAREAEQAEADRRAQDKAHRSAVNRAARDALVQGGLSEEDATKAVIAIASGSVPRVAISY